MNWHRFSWFARLALWQQRERNRDRTTEIDPCFRERTTFRFVDDMACR